MVISIVVVDVLIPDQFNMHTTHPTTQLNNHISIKFVLNNQKIPFSSVLTTLEASKNIKVSKFQE